MFLTLAFIGAMAVAPSDTIPAASTDSTAPAPVAGPVSQPVGVGAVAAFADDTTPRRRKAVQISDAYAVRLKIHYIASYATIPIFAAQAIVGQQLYHDESVLGVQPSSTLRSTHDAIALTLGALFLTNTVTGSMNWWETRKNPQGRTWRTIHAALMLASDAGFAYTASLGYGARYREGTFDGRTVHRGWAIGSASVALASYIMMWKPFRRD